MIEDVKKIKETTSYWPCDNKKCSSNDGRLHFHLKNNDTAYLYDALSGFQLEIYEKEKE